MSNINRDINRQNKGSSVISATVYSLLTDKKMKSIVSICKDVVSNDNNIITNTSKRKLDYAVNELSHSALRCNKIASNKYMTSSTHIKCDALPIATSTHKRMKDAILMDETYCLYDSASRCTPDMVHMQEVSN